MVGPVAGLLLRPCCPVVWLLSPPFFCASPLPLGFALPARPSAGAAGSGSLPPAFLLLWVVLGCCGVGALFPPAWCVRLLASAPGLLSVSLSRLVLLLASSSARAGGGLLSSLSCPSSPSVFLPLLSFCPLSSSSCRRCRLWATHSFAPGSKVFFGGVVGYSVLDPPAAPPLFRRRAFGG